MDYGKDSSDLRDEVIELVDIVRESMPSEEPVVDLQDILEAGDSTKCRESAAMPADAAVAFSADEPVELGEAAAGEAVLQLQAQDSLDSVDASLLSDEDAPSSPEEQVFPLTDEIIFAEGSSSDGCEDDAAPKFAELCSGDAVAAASSSVLPSAIAAASDAAVPAAEEPVLVAAAHSTDEASARLEELAAEVRALSQRVDELDQQLAQQIADAGAMFINDASVRLAIEEMVSRMIDVRFPDAEAERPAEQGASAPADAGMKALRDEIAAIRGRVDLLAADIEQTAAAAAARVIREEISVLTAES